MRGPDFTNQTPLPVTIIHDRRSDPLRSADEARNIIIFLEDSELMSCSEIARSSGLDRSTIYRIRYGAFSTCHRSTLRKLRELKRQIKRSI